MLYRFRMDFIQFCFFQFFGEKNLKFWQTCFENGLGFQEFLEVYVLSVYDGLYSFASSKFFEKKI